MKAHLTTTIAAAVLAVATIAPQRTIAANPTAPSMTQPDIVAMADGKPDLTTFVAAVQAAELVSALQGPGPFTVFAPTNEAFAKLPAGQLDDLLKPENRKKLAYILKAHVIKGQVKAADVKPGNVKTLDGEKVAIAVMNGKVTFGGATVVATDLTAGNGVIHQIDTVVIPD